MLEADGFEVVGEAGDGAAGIEAARSLRPDIVLLDVQLPDVDGFEVATRMKAQGGTRVPRLVLTSSRGADELPGDLAESGALGFIPKDELTAGSIRGLLR